MPAPLAERDFRSAHGARRYLSSVPSSSASASAPPLVMMLHGCAQDAADIARGTRLAERAAARGWIALFPEQPESANAKRCWHWYDHAHLHRGAGESALLADLARQVAAECGADTARIYVAGMSAGGVMAVHLAVAYPELFAAVAAHAAFPWRAAGGLYPTLAMLRNGLRAAPPLPVERVAPLFVMHGARDRRVNPINAAQLAEQWRLAIERGEGTRLTYHEERIAAARASALRAVHADARGTPVVERWVVDEIGHAWSGGSAEGTFTAQTGIDATGLMLDFFSRHRHPTTRA